MNSPTNSNADEFEDPLSNFEPIQHESELARVLTEEPVTNIQTQPCTMVAPSLPIHEALQVLFDSQISSVLVVENERLIGIFTERDVLERVVDRYDELKDLPVSEVMTKDPFVVHASDPSGAALAATSVAGYRHVPVLDGEDIVGMVSPQRVFTFLESQK